MQAATSAESDSYTVTNLTSLEEFLRDQDNSLNVSYFSNVPQNCKELPCMLGIDEAGRGPVLGPMVYGVAFCPENHTSQLGALECVDSKTLTEETRDKLFEKICDNSNLMGWGVEVISPNMICNSMLSRTKYSLNQVSMDSAVGLIRATVKAGVNVKSIYVDTVGPPEKYEAYLLSLFPHYEITVAKKADSIFPIVSAASICAKVVRDHSLAVWDFQEGIKASMGEFGSGYPGDPATKKFMTNYCDVVFGYPMLVRFSWQTAQTALDKSAYHVEWETEEEEVKTPSDNMAITSFFKTSSKSIVKKKHDFFLKRNLKNVADF